jgi:hypothetical protein
MKLRSLVAVLPRLLAVDWFVASPSVASLAHPRV